MMIDENYHLAHQWGVSEAADRIRAEICGRAPSTKPWRRWFMPIQAYLDDSYSDSGVHVLAGYMARAEHWSHFATEWEKLLPVCRRGNSGKHRFKMNEMTHRLGDVQLFLDVIRDYVSYSFTIMMRNDDLERARARIWSDNVEIAWSPHDDIANVMIRFFSVKFFELILGDHQNDSWIGPDDKIDIYIDKHAAPDWTFEDWDQIISSIPKYAQEHVGERPRFVDDEEYLPIQAADFLAWWMRKGYEAGTEKTIIKDTFGQASQDKLIRGVNLTFTEDQITDNLIRGLKAWAPIPGLANIYDSNVKPRSNAALDVYDFDKRQNLFSFFRSRLGRLRRDPRN